MIKFFNDNPEIFQEFKSTLALPIVTVRKSSLGEFDELPVFSVSIQDTLNLSPLLLKTLRTKFPITIKGYVFELQEYYPGESDEQKIWEAQLMFSIEKDSKNILEEPINDTSEVLEFLN